ncbi:hypothetical protein WN51_02565 [Melipona quadrifasciata]|uniref:Uncharacterized protein n=1 Tax=Melipona quadrifasciata TaxID=166423 RepID=A0A0M8ZVQ4_9HYME|nr:hypothetical protein WN51_02565 [Melipona quadrifasciata]
MELHHNVEHNKVHWSPGTRSGNKQMQSETISRFSRQKFINHIIVESLRIVQWRIICWPDVNLVIRAAEHATRKRNANDTKSGNSRGEDILHPPSYPTTKKRIENGYYLTKNYVCRRWLCRLRFTLGGTWPLNGDVGIKKCWSASLEMHVAWGKCGKEFEAKIAADDRDVDE